MATQQQTRWAREYETIYVVDPKLDQTEIKKISDRMVEVISKMNGKLTRLDHWGRRKLAYRTQNRTRGFYLCMRYLGYSDIVAELERNLRMQDVIFRFQTSRLRDKCDISKEEVDPAGLEFRTFDIPTDEPELNLEQQLGFVESAYSSRHARPVEDVEEVDAGEETSVDEVEAEAIAAPTTTN